MMKTKNIKTISLAVCFSSLAMTGFAGGEGELVGVDAIDSAVLPSQTFAIKPIEFSGAEILTKTETKAGYAQELADTLAKIHTLKMNFKQTSKQANGHKKEKTGKITLLKPSRYEILIDAPWEQQIISNGIYKWDYDLGFDEVHKTRIFDEQTASPIELLSADADELSNLYTVSLDSQKGDGLIYKLVPKANDSFSEFVLIGIENNLPKSILNRDPLGNDTIFEFSDAELNPIVERDYFDFEVPEGVFVGE